MLTRDEFTEACKGAEENARAADACGAARPEVMSARATLAQAYAVLAQAHASRMIADAVGDVEVALARFRVNGAIQIDAVGAAAPWVEALGTAVRFFDENGGDPAYSFLPTLRRALSAANGA